MFNNIGTKIKLLAKVLCGIGIGIFVILGLYWIVSAISNSSAYEAMTGILLLINGPVLSWVGSVILYGFGQLIENSDMLVAIDTDIMNDDKKEG